ncbi:MAG: hypothetical protein UHL07_07850, partial [Bacteroidaceae bacterium]|nr:hypothetical protein [Bacteroidaceae bacterium]
MFLNRRRLEPFNRLPGVILLALARHGANARRRVKQNAAAFSENAAAFFKKSRGVSEKRRGMLSASPRRFADNAAALSGFY